MKGIYVNFRHLFYGSCIALVILSCFQLALAQEEETYDISLVKTAEVEEKIYEVDGKKVLTQTYTVQEGDWICKILRRKGAMKHHVVTELLSAVRELNQSLDDLDMIHPGDRLIIPLKMTPFLDEPDIRFISPEIEAALIARGELGFENYEVMKGDSLIKIIQTRFNVSKNEVYNRYLGPFKNANPAIDDLDIIYPGQVVRLPVYSNEKVRGPVEKPMAQQPKEDVELVKVTKRENPLSRDLGIIFLEIGEEWVQTGEHFIPLRSGGQANLKANSFPIINLRTGLRVVVDLNNELPDRLAKLIESSWVRIIHLLENDSLETAMDKILTICNYPKLLRKDEPLEIQGDIAVKITGNWIITLSESGSEGQPNIVVINLKDAASANTPTLIKEYLKSLAVKVIDYPLDDADEITQPHDMEILEAGADPAALIEAVLNLTDHPFSAKAEMPIYQSQKADLELTVNADFLLKIHGRDAIIDLTGLDNDMISFLKSNQFIILSLAGQKKPMEILEKTLEFLDAEFDPSPNMLLAKAENEPNNIRLFLPGIVFSDSDSRAVLATTLRLPDELAVLLSERGYRILALSSF